MWLIDILHSYSSSKNSIWFRLVCFWAMFTLTMIMTSDLQQVERATNTRSEVNLRLALRCHYAYGLRHYVVVTWFQFGSSSYRYKTVMHMLMRLYGHVMAAYKLLYYYYYGPRYVKACSSNPQWFSFEDPAKLEWLWKSRLGEQKLNAIKWHMKRIHQPDCGVVGMLATNAAFFALAWASMLFFSWLRMSKKFFTSCNIINRLSR